MKHGCVAVFDALGFRGIWRRHRDPQVVLRRLATLRKTALARVRAQYGNPNALRRRRGEVLDSVRVSFLSDTIVIGVAHKEPQSLKFRREAADFAPQFLETACMLLVAQMVSSMLIEAVSQKPGFIYRGCIACGEFDMNDSFLIGPAVDEAVESMGAAQGALVWTLPSANAVLSGTIGRIPDLVSYDVPLKGGDVFRTFAVSPLPEWINAERRQEISASILNKFDRSRIGIEIKRQNTERFLNECLRAAKQLDSVSAAGTAAPLGSHDVGE